VVSFVTQSLKTITASALRGTASGVIFMAVFGTLWAYTGIMGLEGLGGPLLLLTAVAIGIALISGGVSLIRAARVLPNQVSNEDLRGEKRRMVWFNVIFAAEGLAIAITIAINNVTRHTELIPVIIAIIVGVHFLPLASLFHVKLYYVTGALLCLLAISTWLFLPEKISLGEHQINTFMAVIGFGSALILWGTSLAIWLMGRSLKYPTK